MRSRQLQVKELKVTARKRTYRHREGRVPPLRVLTSTGNTFEAHILMRNGASVDLRAAILAGAAAEQLEIRSA